MRATIISGSISKPHECGVGGYAHNLSAALSRFTNMNLVVMTEKGGDSLNLNESFYIDSWSFRELKKIIYHLLLQKPDFIHMQFHTKAYGRKIMPRLLPFILTVFKFKVIQTWHENFYKTLIQGLPAIPNLIASKKIIVVRNDFLEKMHPIYRWLARKKRFYVIENISNIGKSASSNEELLKLKLERLHGKKYLISYFGFLSPGKGVEKLFEIIDPANTMLLMICDIALESDNHTNPNDVYKAEIIRLASSKKWENSIQFTGHLPGELVADLLAASDASIFPFSDGGGMWNTSTKAATLQGIFTLITSKTKLGYSESENIYYADPIDIVGMKKALYKYIGKKHTPNTTLNDWDEVAKKHIQIYKECLE